MVIECNGAGVLGCCHRLLIKHISTQGSPRCSLNAKYEVWVINRAVCVCERARMCVCQGERQSLPWRPGLRPLTVSAANMGH